jgi:hypothetical protein
MSNQGLPEPTPPPDVLDLIDELDPEEVRSMHEVIARYGDENGLNLDRMRADLAAGTHPYQQPRRAPSAP